jgi:hypothetical protein
MSIERMKELESLGLAWEAREVRFSFTKQELTEDCVNLQKARDRFERLYHAAEGQLREVKVAMSDMQARVDEAIADERRDAVTIELLRSDKRMLEERIEGLEKQLRASDVYAGSLERKNERQDEVMKALLRHQNYECEDCGVVKLCDDHKIIAEEAGP